MKITILTVGKLKEKYWKQAIAEYEKRLSAYSKIEIIEVPDEKVPENMSDKEVEQVKEKEGQRLLAKVKQQSTVITLEIKGNMLTSEGLAKEIESRMTRGQSDFTFIIGGSNGLHKDVLDRSDYALSFSKMTFPHQMMRVILIEQVYRAFKIMRGEAYHK
ncbi:23S rRNA (pseudouridine(1915)-N(3))-methyltransferase RlmH [Staphylococcus saprophyticus]|uniref:23S rRNA (pseudouridine(1915)-N(3))-methyltransferase RlmH n=1 Tax=Staphylococcus saprophyticus TaxID=29385 RepID=UPI0008529B30|nr:23S rRNA (pseudouridine(1915)-N(3))-methyltransferase RlmH [Staphylococcus saprophyticus]ASE58191.1 23S rRNA (pseudouridine(1915)-N(3))-methyltransferase RlmH [Staphylococcus saprophyticus]MDW3870247.1 23S rRNA (pseudouridine(1915)-N(3))-methyltransferase RlmH [Staphylococcus saprophyticus]MDW3899795.1 23S rRNA (pseudouridine(1915)-N(3))-methyltransferase RlmH [Staphylococcus saprophyticus]MDW3904907.1 23S rRNA (pseudouridine(1915)-N(3))-methyltransferase RlmH [Staphylococcus saprophyticus]